MTPEVDSGSGMRCSDCNSWCWTGSKIIHVKGCVSDPPIRKIEDAEKAVDKAWEINR